MKKSIAVGAFLVLSLLLLSLSGCGCGDSNTPGAMVEKLIQAVKSGDIEEAKSYFVDPGFYDLFT